MRISNNEARSKALVAAKAASSKKAEEIVILEVGPLISITDYFVICSGKTERQVKTISEEVFKKLAENGWKPYRTEGERDQRWVLLDYLDLVVHIFHAEERDYYRIERLWADATPIPFEEDTVAAPGR
jgi:ribosome-associated protein